MTARASQAKSAQKRRWWEDPLEPFEPIEVAGADSRDADTRRRAQVLAAWASGPPGETLTAFARRAGIARDTWRVWLHEPAFAAEFERLARLRARIQLEDVWQTLSAVDAAVLVRALEGDSAAAALIYKRLGVVREELALTVDGAEREPTVEELEARLEQLENVRLAAEEAEKGEAASCPNPQKSTERGSGQRVSARTGSAKKSRGRGTPTASSIGPTSAARRGRATTGPERAESA